MTPPDSSVVHRGCAYRCRLPQNDTGSTLLSVPPCGSTVHLATYAGAEKPPFDWPGPAFDCRAPARGNGSAAGMADVRLDEER